MIETSASQPPSAAEMDDGASGDDPGPSSPITLVVSHEAWCSLGDVEAVVFRAVDAVTVQVPDAAGRELAVVLTSDAELRALNAQFRGLDKPTNVLSFPPAALPPSPVGAGAVPLGDIVIAYETVLREAGEEGKPSLHHLAHMIVHGALHLAGFDHETDAEAGRMEILERDILASMGIPDPYSSENDARPSPNRHIL